ncbi:hypothetical protein BC938DRAFT_472789 [Jimgerdemannia flammicorona]|uniref:Uncharacterized protein n=1 Tax=Jimgerdemannia flammicorona TaxID=994334 RepID=A0A433Q5C6_9FUNG|nr:hypothetical protein BC938DRAFT_472789 [Jimgerdemannia flammicorona]
MGTTGTTNANADISGGRGTRLQLTDENDGNADADANASISGGGGTGLHLTDAPRKQHKEYGGQRLKSGRRVEDILYEFGTLNKIQELESMNDKDHLQLDGETEACINTFAKTSVREIREVMRQLASRRGASYDIEKDFSVDAIMLQPNALSTEHHDNWFNINIWGQIIDKAFGDMKGVDIARRESCSVASRDRKNKKRKCEHLNRKAMGWRRDAIIRKHINGRTFELGGAEAGRYYVGEGGSKWILERRSDMLFGLCDRVKVETPNVDQMVSL